MSCEAETRNALREGGRRVTTPRLRIACVLQHAGGHRTVDEIHRALLDRDAGAATSLSTVYRTLDTLVQLRLVSEVEDGSGVRAAYQWLDTAESHHHLVCGRCGADRALDGELFERLSAQIRRETGFQPFLDHFVVRGLCRACRAAEVSRGGSRSAAAGAGRVER